MKKSILSALLILACTTVFAQMKENDGTEIKRVKKEKRVAVCAPFYIGLSFGINNPAGFIGLDLNLPLSSHVSLGAGAGASTWGDKVHLDIKYHLNGCQPGFAFGGGITHSFGLNNFTESLPTIYGTESVNLQLVQQTNVFVAAYYYWTLKHARNRGFVELGWSVPFTSPVYNQLSGDPLTTAGDATMKILAPGGLMVGLGYSFGVGHTR